MFFFQLLSFFLSWSLCLFLFLYLILIYCPSSNSTKIPLFNLTAESGKYGITHADFSIRVTTGNCVTNEYWFRFSPLQLSSLRATAAERSKLYKENSMTFFLTLHGIVLIRKYAVLQQYQIPFVLPHSSPFVPSSGNNKGQESSQVGV